MTLAIEKIKRLTYDDYLAEAEIKGRYEIIDGVREFMTQPSTLRQIIFSNVGRLFHQFQISSKTAFAFLAPIDIVITSHPTLRVRQPDVMLISKQRYGTRDLYSSIPLQNAPELIVEILSPSESRRSIEGKIDDYQSVAVLECWLVTPESKTVQLISLGDGTASSVTYASGENIQSRVFSDLITAVNDVFWVDEDLVASA